uniref:Uncharacterized protein n=1 Tax=Mycena chlorophos TaxID=658473 RepID=A0ABQ0LEN7_MYCCL|nr:predicted protein [Mycena chlorophos]
MWRVGAVPNLSYDYRDDAVPGFVPPPPKKLRSKTTKDDSSLPKSKTTISLHSTESDETSSTKSSGTDHDVRPPKSPLTSPLRLLRRNRDAFPDSRGVPPVPPLPIAFPSHEELTESPIETPAWSLSGSLHRVLVKRPSLLRAKSRPSLEDADRPMPEMPSRPLRDEESGGRRSHPIVHVDIATPSLSRRRDESVDTTPTPTPIAPAIHPALFRTNTIDSIASNITTIQFASPISSGAAGKYQSTVAQDPEVDELAEGAEEEDEDDWRLEGGSGNLRLKRSGSLSKVAKRLGLEEGARKTATPPPAVPRPGPSRPQPSWSAALPLAPPPLAPPPRPAKSPARLAAAAAKHNRRWSISSFAPSEPDADAAGETALAAGARSETHTFAAPSRTRQPRALPIPPGFFTHAGAADKDPDDESESEAGRTAAVLRSEYLPVRSSSKPTDGLLSPEGYASRKTDHEQSWYGEWNRGNIQDVITSLRELR